jgi:histidinol-phosphate aminotransferase
LGLKVVPSATNFVYVETGHPPKQVYEVLLHQGVIVRPLGWMGMPDGLRISVGTEEENQRAVEALAGFVRSAQPVEGKASLGD